MGAARDRLLSAAAHHFYRDGVHATGIDTLTAEAQVAKKSLYNNFSSKAELVSAYIEARHAEWLALYQARVAQAHTAQERALAVFDAYLDHAQPSAGGAFRGCGLLNVAAEFPAGSPERAAVRAHKEEVEQLLADAVADLAGPDRAAGLAEHLSFLLEGAVARAGLEASLDRLEHARALAAGLLARP